MPKYEYPSHLITSSILGNLATKGVFFALKRDECAYIKALDAQKPINKGIFGNGFLINDAKANDLKRSKAKANDLKRSKAKANDLKRSKAKANDLKRSKAKAEAKAEAIVFELSEREREIIKSLN